MSRISKEKEARIMSNILSILYENNLKSLFTAEISKIEVRDEEFIKRLLEEMQKKGLVVAVHKNPNGKDYIRRIRWRLTNQAFKAYKDAVFPQL